MVCGCRTTVAVVQRDVSSPGARRRSATNERHGRRLVFREKKIRRPKMLSLSPPRRRSWPISLLSYGARCSYIYIYIYIYMLCILEIASLLSSTSRSICSSVTLTFSLFIFFSSLPLLLSPLLRCQVSFSFTSSLFSAPSLTNTDEQTAVQL